MIILFRAFRNTLVFSQDRETPLGLAYDCVIDPRNLAIVALWVKTYKGLRILQVSEIVTWNRMRIIVHNDDDFIDPDDALRLKDIFEEEKQIIGAKVWESGRVIGQVRDFSFDSKAHFVLSLSVAKVFLGIFVRKKRLIHRRQIVRIDDEGIHVASGEITVPLESTEQTGRNLIPAQDATAPSSRINSK